MSLLRNTTDLFHSKKDKENLARLQREKDEREAQAETFSMASTIAPSSSMSAGADDASKPIPSACGQVHSNNFPCDAPGCKGNGLSTAQKLGRKLGFVKERKVEDGVRVAREKLDGMSDAEKARLREDLRSRKASEGLPTQAGGGVMFSNC